MTDRYVIHHGPFGQWYVLDTITEHETGECKVAGKPGAWEIYHTKHEAREAAKKFNEVEK